MDWVSEQRDALHAKRDRLVAGLAAAGFQVHPPQGTYFVMADIRPLGYDDGLTFVRTLARRAGVVAIPAQVFYADERHGSPPGPVCFLQTRRRAGRGSRSAPRMGRPVAYPLKGAPAVLPGNG